MSPADSEDQRVGSPVLSPDVCHFPLWALRAGPLGPRDRLQASLALRLSNGGLSVFLCGRLMSGAGWPVSTLSYLEL